MKEIRLNKRLSELGVCSRREADRLIEAGEVKVDGQMAVTGQKVLESQKIVCGQKTVWDPEGREAGGPVKTRPRPVWLVVNKPKGIVCTTSSRDRAKTIVELVGYPDRVYPVGRLDKDSRGLILMTNQGDLVNQIMRSGNAHEKEYEVRVDKPLTEAFLTGMAAGVELKELNQKTLPCKIRKTGEDRFSLILTQGLNRQIRRMCEVFGYQVLDLRRVRIMNIRLGDLREGGYRKMTGQEYEKLAGLLLESGSSNLPYACRDRESREKAREYRTNSK